MLDRSRHRNRIAFGDSSRVQRLSRTRRRRRLDRQYRAVRVAEHECLGGTPDDPFQFHEGAHLEPVLPQQHVVDEQQASSAFDPVITYSKGQAVLRMFENYLGPDTFRDGVRRYMKARAFSNATTADLWQALGSASNQDINAVAAGWTEQAGFPVVIVSSRCEADNARTITLTQQRFLLRPATDSGPSEGRDGIAAAQVHSDAHWK